MKTIIAGSRGLGLSAVLKALTTYEYLDDITEVVSGGARGVDLAGEEWARFMGLPVKRFPADWDKYGKVAGHLRNKEMADYAHALVAVWDGRSSGTKGMISLARFQLLPVHIWKPA